MTKEPSLLIVVVILVLIAIAAVVAKKQYRIAKDETRRVECEAIPGIICIGDSLTHGPEKSYPYNLEKLMIADGYFMPVYNLGIGGENTVTIAGRLGGIPYKVKKFDIPEDTTSVKIEFIDDEKHRIKPFRQLGNSAINPVVINGVAGEISYNEDEDQFYFVRVFETEDLTDRQRELIGGADTSQDNQNEGNYSAEYYQVETVGATKYQDGIYIVFMGENLGWTSIDELISQQKSIINRQTRNKDKYLIIGLTSGDSESRRELEEAMVNEYGDKYINLRAYFTGTESSSPGGKVLDESVDNIIKDAEKYGVVFTDADIKDMEKGIVPECLREDGVHYNDAGYALLAAKVYERMTGLGYYDSAVESARNFSRWWGLANKLEIYINSKK